MKLTYLANALILTNLILLPWGPALFPGVYWWQWAGALVYWLALFLLISGIEASGDKAQ